MPLISFHSLSPSSSLSSLMCRTVIHSICTCALCALQINSIHSIILIKYKSKCSRIFPSSIILLHISRISPTLARTVHRANRVSMGKYFTRAGDLGFGAPVGGMCALYVHPSDDEYGVAASARTRVMRVAETSPAHTHRHTHSANVRKTS